MCSIYFVFKFQAVDMKKLTKMEEPCFYAFTILSISTCAFTNVEGLWAGFSTRDDSFARPPCQLLSFYSQ